MGLSQNGSQRNIGLNTFLRKENLKHINLVISHWGGVEIKYCHIKNSKKDI